MDSDLGNFSLVMDKLIWWDAGPEVWDRGRGVGEAEASKAMGVFGPSMRRVGLTLPDSLPEMHGRGSGGVFWLGP